MTPTAKALVMPWARNAARYSAPRRLVLKMSAGEVGAIPSAADVRLGAQAAWRHRRGPVDRICAARAALSAVRGVLARPQRAPSIGARHRAFNHWSSHRALSRTRQSNCSTGATSLPCTTSERVRPGGKYRLLPCSVPLERAARPYVFGEERQRRLVAWER